MSRNQLDNFGENPLGKTWEITRRRTVDKINTKKYFSNLCRLVLIS